MRFQNTSRARGLLTIAAVAGLSLACTLTSNGTDQDGGDTGPLIVEPIEIEIGDEYSGQEASLARNFFFVFDGSGSMSDRPDRGCRGDQRFSDKLGGAKWALNEFVTKIPDDVNIGLYVFDSAGRDIRTPLGSDNRQQFLEAVNGIQAGGGTPLAQAIRGGTDELVERYRQQLGYGEFRLVVVTDGLAKGIGDAARYAARYGVPIYAIGLCIGEDHPLRRYAVSYRAADSFQDLQQGLEETMAELPVFDATEFEKDAG